MPTNALVAIRITAPNFEYRLHSTIITMNWSLVIALLFVQSVTRWRPSSCRHLSDEELDHYCGSQLVEALIAVCKDAGINGGTQAVRTEKWMGHGVSSTAAPSRVERSLDEDVFSHEKNGNGALPPTASHKPPVQPSASDVHSRKRRGIVDECCHSPCSLATLKEYCN